MIVPDREDIQLVSRSSNWPAASVDHAFKTYVYNKRQAWQKFLKLLLLVSGIGFTTAGIIFFFAYNWEHLHKFVKIGLIEGLLLIVTLIVLKAKLSDTARNTLLTGASILVGVLFAVFGQVYQTGANAYDLFLNWVLCITLWVLVSDFAPLWLVYIFLINVTFQLYSEQRAHNWTSATYPAILFLVNSLFLLISLALSSWKPLLKIPSWFNIVLATWAALVATFGIGISLHERPTQELGIFITITAILYTAGMLYGFRQRNLFYLALIPGSVIGMLASAFLRHADGAIPFLLTGLFIIGAVTLLVKGLIDQQKKWSHEKEA